MISSLRIENFVLIDSANIHFNAGFTVITGETGSGKSILLSALNLILGERANFSVIGSNSDKSTVEAVVSIKDFGLEAFFEKHQLDYFDQTIVRREIHKQGRSRAFINDTPVQLNVLKEFSSQLIHIHSQYNTLELKEASFQMKVLDILAQTVKKKDAYLIEFQSLKAMKKELEEKRLILQESLSQVDYNTFQLEELESLQLDAIDYEGIQKSIKKGENADDILTAFQSVFNTLKSDDGILSRLGELKSALAKSISFDSKLEEIDGRLDSVAIELSDIVDEAETKSQEVEFDPRELDKMIAQIDSYNRISQKHRVSTQQELISITEGLSNSSKNFDQLKAEINDLETLVNVNEELLFSKARKLHLLRVNAVVEIEKKIKEELKGLKLENTELNFNLSESGELSTTGISKLEILFSPNIGVEPVPIHKAASGGELSRVMLALQSLMSTKVRLRTMLFDEIDTGVSGDVAQKMGQTLKKMGQGMQVIAITHLPQVAAKGSQHLKVMKDIVNGKTMTSVIELSLTQQIEETARLMSGNEINQAALENAKALMQ